MSAPDRPEPAGSPATGGAGPGRTRHTRRAAAALLVNACIWGLSWWPLRRLQDLGLHPLWSTAGVYLVSVAVLLVWHPHAARGLRKHPGLAWLFLASGLANVGFNWGVTIGDVVRVVLLFYLMPAWSVPLAWWLLGERPGLGALGRVGLALAGVALVVGQPNPGTATLGLPEGLGLLGGAAFALTNVLLRRHANAPPGARALAMFGGGAAMALAVAWAGTAMGALAAPPRPAADWLLLGGALALAFLGGNLALQYGAARLTAHATALIMVSEVAFAGVSSVLLGASDPGWGVLAGGLMIVGAAVLAGRADDPP